MAEERDEVDDKTTHELLDDWREAERDAKRDAEDAPDSAAGRISRTRADVARKTFHDREDDERERGGDYRPRKADDLD